MNSKNSRGSNPRSQRITRAQLEQTADLALSITKDPHAFDPIRLSSGGVVEPSPTVAELLLSAVAVGRKKKA